MGGKKRDFKGVWIPKEIWLSSELTGMEKLMWSEINSLDNEFGCTVKNEHFMDTFHLKERQIRDYIKRLKDLGLIEVENNKAKNSRTIRIVGKYRRTPDETLDEIDGLKKAIVEKYKVED